jgi:hypothetical protein
MSRHRIAPTGPSRRPRGTKAGRAAVLAATDRVVNHLRGLYAELEGLPRREDGGVSIPRNWPTGSSRSVTPWSPSGLLSFAISRIGCADR